MARIVDQQYVSNALGGLDTKSGRGVPLSKAVYLRFWGVRSLSTAMDRARDAGGPATFIHHRHFVHATLAPPRSHRSA